MSHRKPKTAPLSADASTVVPVNPYEAFRLVAYSYGVKELAERMGLSPGVLYNKADSSIESHAQPTLRDLMTVTRETGDMRVLESLNRLFDRGSYDLTPVPPSDAALLELLARVGSEQGAMCSALHKGLADRRFTPDDFAEVRAEAFDLINAVLAFVQRLEGLVDAP